MVLEVNSPPLVSGVEFKLINYSEAPEAMTSHPLPYTLIQFNFIGSYHDFSSVKVSLQHLLLNNLPR